MKYAKRYSFTSPLSAAAIRARLGDIGPWQWHAAADDRVTASLPSPDGGTIVVIGGAGTSVVDVDVEATPERIQAMCDTLFTHVLPAIAAADIKEEGARGSALPKRAMYRHFAYAFHSPLTLEEMVAKLNNAGPWAWCERENDELDAYLSAAPLREPHRGRAKIYMQYDRKIIDVELSSDQPDADAVVEQVERELLERVLPSIGAQNLTLAEPLE